MTRSEYERQHAMAWLSRLVHGFKESRMLRQRNEEGFFASVIHEELTELRQKLIRDERKITEKTLLESGFSYRDLGDESPYEVWTKCGIDVWNYNDLYWIVDMLDQNAIHREFHTMADLEEFFAGCGLSMKENAPA